MNCSNSQLVKERGVVPTVKLLRGEWSGVDLSNYFIIGGNSIHVEEDSRFEFKVSNDSLWIKAHQGAKGYIPISFEIGENQYTLMSQIENVHYYNFQYVIDDIQQYNSQMDTNKVFVMGNFNNWSRISHPLKFDGLMWNLTLPFPPGSYEYKFVVNGEEVLDSSNRISKPNGFGGLNSIFEVTSSMIDEACIFKHSSKDEAKELRFSGCGKYSHFDTLVYQVMFDNEQLDSSNFKWEQDEEIIHNLLFNVKTNSLGNGLLRIYVNQKNHEGAHLENQTIIKNGKPLTPLVDKNDPHFKVLYSLMVDRFNNGNSENDNPINDSEVHPLANYHGGDIVGITQKIKEGYFSNLGINTIWMSPIMQGPDTSFTEYVPPHRKYTGYHGYWPVDSRKVDPRFGTAEELKEMIEIAHEFGIKVLLDFVSNHTHEDHHYFSEHPEWYGNIELENGTPNIRNWSDETMLTTWFDTFLPSFDYENNEEAIDQVVDDAIYWITQFGFDGFRQDATKHVPHQFWKKLRSRLDDEFPEKDIFQIGETFGSDELIQSYVNPGELDSQFNFSNYFSLREYLSSSNSVHLNQLMRGINQNLTQYGPINLMGNITSSHDQVRFMALVDGQIRMDENGVERSYNDLPTTVNHSESYDRHFMFTAMNMMLPGIPVIYYGEEYGQIGANDPGNRTDMKFQNEWTDKEGNLYQKVRILAHARQKYPSLALGDLTFVDSIVEGFICKKTYFDNECMFIFNFSKKEKKINIIPDSDGQWLSLLDRSVLNIKGRETQLTLKPFETKVFRLND